MPNRFARFHVEVDFIGTVLSLLAVPASAVEVVLFLLLLLCDLGSKMVIGVGAEFAEIGADSADALGRRKLQLLDEVERLKSLVHPLIESKQGFINTKVHWLIPFPSERSGSRVRNVWLAEERHYAVPFAGHTSSAAIENPT